MLCRRAADMAILNGWVDYFERHTPEPTRGRGLKWIADTIRKNDGDVSKAADELSQVTENSKGIPLSEVRPGNQAHFRSPFMSDPAKRDAVPGGNEGKNLIARKKAGSAKDVEFMTAGGRGVYSADDATDAILDYSTNDPRDTPRNARYQRNDVRIDEIRRAKLPHWLQRDQNANGRRGGGQSIP